MATGEKEVSDEEERKLSSLMCRCMVANVLIRILDFTECLRSLETDDYKINVIYYNIMIK